MRAQNKGDGKKRPSDFYTRPENVSHLDSVSEKIKNTEAEKEKKKKEETREFGMKA